MSGSGRDRMRPAPDAADAARAMTTAIRHHRQDGTRRFEREPAPPAELPRYEVDADAVAAAIVERLLAGRTLRLPPRDPRRP